MNLAEPPVKAKPALREFTVNVKELTFTVNIRADEVNDAVLALVVRKLGKATFAGGLQITRGDVVKE